MDNKELTRELTEYTFAIQEEVLESFKEAIKGIK